MIVTLPKIVIHTDVIVEYLLHTESVRSVLRLALEKFFCYTTVFTAVELFSIAHTEKERQSIEDALMAMKILGLNARSSKNIGRWISQQPSLPRLNVLIGGLCIESQLPLLVMQRNEFRGVKGLKLVPANLLKKNLNAREILKAATK